MNSEYRSEKLPPGGARWNEFPHLIWRGAGMGMAEVVPGVSGGTIALITGILGRLIESIHSINIVAVKMLFTFRIRAFLSNVHWRFLLMLFSGQIFGILFFTRIVPLPYLLRTFPEPVLGLFFGLVLGSIIMLARSAGIPDWRGVSAYLGGATLGAVVIAGVRAHTPDAPWFMVIAGAISVCAWILPGISGSFMLLLLHKYDYVWEALTFSNSLPYSHNIFAVIMPFGIGAVVGIVSFSRFFSYILSRWPNYTAMSMNGLLIASLWAIFPFRREFYETVAGGKEKLVAVRPVIPSTEKLATVPGALALVLVATGFAFVLWINYMALKKRNNAPENFSG